MKVLFQIRCLSPGGLELAVATLAQEFLKHTERIDAVGVLVTEQLGNGAIRNELEQAGVQVFLTEGNYLNYMAAIRKFEPDIINPQDCRQFFPLGVDRVKVVETIQNTYAKGWFSPTEWHFEVERQKFLDGQIFLTRNGLDQYRRSTPKGPHVLECTIPNPYSYRVAQDRTSLPERTADGVTRFLYPARIASAKGHRFLIEVVTFLKSLGVHPDIRICCAGKIADAPLYEELRRLIEERGIAQYFEFRGFVERMADLYRTHDCLLMSSYFEGLSLASVEGMFFGLPQIRSYTSDCEELLGANERGIITEPLDPRILFINHSSFLAVLRENRFTDTSVRSFGEAICSFVANRDSWAQKSAAIAAYAEARFSPLVIARQYLDFFDTVCRNGHGHRDAGTTPAQAKEMEERSFVFESLAVIEGLRTELNLALESRGHYFQELHNARARIGILDAQLASSFGSRLRRLGSRVVHAPYRAFRGLLRLSIPFTWRRWILSRVRRQST